MIKTFRLTRLWVALSFLMLIGCSGVEQKEDQEIAFSPPAIQTPVESEARAEPSVPPPPPILPLKKPEGAMELEAVVSLSVTEGSLKEVLQALTEQAAVNLIIDRDVVDEQVTLNIRNLPLWQALDALLTAHNLYFSTQPGYIRVSRMMTRIFHLDYIRSLRASMSNTQVSLSSGSAGGGTTGGAAGGGGTTSLGALGEGSSLGDITIQTLESVDFWTDLDLNLRQIMQDPLYKILRTEYDQRDLRRELSMLPYEEEFKREALKHRLEMFRIQREMMQKQLETGVAEAVLPTALEPMSDMASETGGGEDRQGSQQGGEEEENLVGTFSLDPQTGTLVVTTTSEVMSRVEGFLAQLRKNLTRQVYIDVQILEVSLSKDKTMGVDWSSFPGLLQYYRMPQLRDIVESQMVQQAESGGGGGGTSTGGEGVTNPLAASPFPAAPDGVFQLGVLSTIGNHQAIQYALNSVISFLQKFGDVKAISRPQITTLNNQPALVSVGVNDFYVTFEQQTTGSEGLATSSVSSRINPVFIGVTLNVTPQISPDGEIAMKIVPAINRKVGEKRVPTGIPSAPEQAIPLVETRQTSTIVRVGDRQTVIISGLIQEHERSADKEVPYLADLPMLGKLFRHSAVEKGSSELVMLLTPRLATRPPQMQDLGYHTIAGKN